MKVYVTEMPKTMENCPFCRDGECGICHNPCMVEKCGCLKPLVVTVEDVEEKENVQEFTD